MWEDCITTWYIGRLFTTSQDGFSTTVKWMWLCRCLFGVDAEVSQSPFLEYIHLMHLIWGLLLAQKKGQDNKAENKRSYVHSVYFLTVRWPRSATLHHQRVKITYSSDFGTVNDVLISSMALSPVIGATSLSYLSPSFSSSWRCNFS